MKRFTPFIFLLVLTLVVSLVALVSRQALRTPREVLLEVQQAMADSSVDEEILLRHLDSSLRRLQAARSDASGDLELEGDLYLTRGRLLLRIGATDRARADFKHVLQELRPGDREVRRLLIEAERSQGQQLDALAHLKILIEDEPDFGPAWVEKGLLLDDLAEETLGLCAEKLNYSLVEQDAAQAMILLRQLAARDPADTRRGTTIFQLRQLFPSSAQEIYGQVLGLCSEANRYLAECREALIRSFSIELDPQALARYLSILGAAGQQNEMLHLGSLIALDRSKSAEPESAMLLLKLLLKRGDAHHAAQLATNWVNRSRPLTGPFLRLCCDALYHDKQWSSLLRAALRLRSIGTLEDGDVVSFYMGLNHANGRKPNPQLALSLLGEFVRSTTPNPFPGARAVAWRTMVRLHHDAGDISAEREALQAALKIAPDDGELWLRTAEIQRDTKHGGYSLPLDSWVKGMTLLPERNDELMETFISLGERRLLAEERVMDVLFNELKREGRTSPKRDYGPFVLWRIAQMQGETGHPQAQLAVAIRLSDRVPGFVPALDQQIEARLALHDREQYRQLILERVALTGANPSAARLLSSVAVDEYSPEELLDVIQLDPRGTGRLVAAAWYHDNGESALAIKTLELAGRKARSDGEHYFGAQVMMSNGDARSALRWLAEIPADSPFQARKLRLAVTAAGQLNDQDLLKEHLTALIDAKLLSIDSLLQIADELLLNQHLEAARYVIEAIPSEMVVDQGPLFLREVQLCLAEGELDRAENAIERSGAFVQEAEYVLSRLLLDSFRGDWVSARENAKELSQLPVGTQGQNSLWLKICTDEDEEALELAHAAREREPFAARWTVAENIARLTLGQEVSCPPTYGKRAGREMQRFLLGSGQKIFDPRQIAVLLLAAESPEFRSFVLGSLKIMPRTERGVMWPGLLFANLAFEEGNLVEAGKAHNRVVSAHPDCDQSWNELVLVKIARYGSTLHNQVHRVLTRQLIAQAKDDEQSAARMLLSGQRARQQGDLNSALQSIMAAAQKAPDWFEAQSAMASLNVELGRWEMALETWRGLVASSNVIQQPRALQGLIGALDSAIQLSPPPLPLADLKSELDAIEKDFPGIPTCSLALARLDLALDPNNPALGLERAWARLRRLREGQPGVSLEAMERGSTQAWATFYVETDPGSAEAFIRNELQLQPGNLELWRLLGRVHRDLGHYEEALRVLSQTAAIAPNVQVAEEFAAAQVASGATPKTMSRTLKLLGIGAQQDNLEAQLLYAESLLNEYNKDSWAAAIERLERLWDARHQLESVEQLNRVSQLLGRALLLRGDDLDAGRAAEILRTQFPHTKVPYQREEFQCLIGIGDSRSGLAQ